jgi:predicted transcriptional regulator of viral defense system
LTIQAVECISPQDLYTQLLGLLLKTIPLKEALRLTIIKEHRKPVITEYEIAKYMFAIYKNKKYDGIKIGKISKNEPDYFVVRNNILDMESFGLIQRIQSLPIFSLKSHNFPNAQQVACSANPCSYIAYLNAMEWHGITDRIPKTVQVVTCSNAEFKNLVNNDLTNEFPEAIDLKMLIPKRLVELPKIDGKSFIFHQKRDFKIPKEQSGSGGVRVSSIGDTFLDMLKKPEFCGGFDHVFDVFKEYGSEYLPLITKAINKNGNAMDKARAGYILEEVLGISHKLIDKWKESVSRGGSRKLIASQPYKAVFSETWCISINNEE